MTNEITHINVEQFEHDMKVATQFHDCETVNTLAHMVRCLTNTIETDGDSVEVAALDAAVTALVRIEKIIAKQRSAAIPADAEIEHAITPMTVSPALIAKAMCEGVGSQPRSTFLVEIADICFPLVRA